MKTLKITTAIILILLSFRSFAQQTDFSGTWMLKEKQHITGPDYANNLPSQIKVDYEKDSIIMESISVGADGQNVTGKQAFSMGGKPSATIDKNSNRKYIRSLQWTGDKKTLSLTTVIYVPGDENKIDLTRTESWTLVGNMLTVDKKSAETTHESWEVKGVFEKQ